MVEKGILEHLTAVCSNGAQAIVLLRKLDGELRICGDYKIGVNLKICSKSFPITNIETSIHKLLGIKFFALNSPLICL